MVRELEQKTQQTPKDTVANAMQNWNQVWKTVFTDLSPKPLPIAPPTKKGLW
jgi:hypothetical protein